MQFTVTADTDIGTGREKNQDSVLIKHGRYPGGEIVMAIVCDGMGGLSKGELASATVIREFARWYDEELPHELVNLDMRVIGGKWELMLRNLNGRILEHGKKKKITMGTTFTGILLAGKQSVIVHVGDTRIYHIGKRLRQLTSDQTVVAREVRRGALTQEQARKDKRRNMLLQCIGASDVLEPEIVVSGIEKGTYVLCTDGFWHEVAGQEMQELLNDGNLVNDEAMHVNARYLIELVKQRKEKDNISIILIKPSDRMQKGSVWGRKKYFKSRDGISGRMASGVEIDLIEEIAYIHTEEMIETVGEDESLCTE